MRPGIGSRALPGRPVAGGDAGVGTAGRLAQGGERLCRIGGRHALEAERGRGIEEAIRERADMEGARDAGEHDAQTGPIGDHGGQMPGLNGGLVERPRDARSRRTAKRSAALPPVEIVQQVIELAEPALRLDLGAKPRCAGPGIALESGDRGVLILDHAGDGAERTVGDVPRDRPPELPRRDAPRLAIGPGRDHRCIGVAEGGVEVVAEGVELADHLAGKIRLGDGAEA